MFYALQSGPSRRQRITLFYCLLLVSTIAVLATRSSLSGASNVELRGIDLFRQAEKQQEAADRQQAFASFSFDPNTVSRAALLRLGLSDRQADSWLKFRGNRKDAFRKPADIGRLFVLSAAQKAHLIPLANISTSTQGKRARSQVRGRDRWQRFSFDPNTVTETELQQLGLSPRQAQALVRYRARARFREPADLRRLRTLSDRQKDHLVALAVIAPVPRVVTPRFPFDPNRISADSLQLLGFPAWQARSLLKYRSTSVRTFRQPEDLLRVRALDSALVQALLPFVRIPPEPAGATPRPTTYASPPAAALLPASLDVNASGTSRWQQLPGIGPFRAERILAFRNTLGGFYTLEQLQSVPELPDSVYQQILPFLRVGPVYRQIAVNRASFAELKSHPNISRSLANVIVRNRTKFGPFRTPADLDRLRLITDTNRPTILPYLSFE